MILRRVCAAASLVIVAACGPQTRISASTGAADIGTPTRLFVLSYIAGDFGPEFSPAFNKHLIRIVRQCGTDAEVATIAPLELGTAPQLERMRQFRPDAVLRINRLDRIVTEDATNFRTYGVELADPRSGKTVWKANATLRGQSVLITTDKRAELFAVELTNRMKADGIFQICPALPS